MDGGTQLGNYAGFASGHIPSREPAKKKRGWMWLSCIGLIALLAVAGVAVYLSLPKDKSSDGSSTSVTGTDAADSTASRSANGVEATTESDANTTPTTASDTNTTPPDTNSPPPTPEASETAAETTATAAPTPAEAPTETPTESPTAAHGATTAGVLDASAAAPSADVAPEVAAAPSTTVGVPVSGPLEDTDLSAGGPAAADDGAAAAMAPTGFLGFTEEELPGGFLGLPRDTNGKYSICIGAFGEEYKKPNKPEEECGVQVNADDTIVLGEYFGGFDGFFSTDPADGHENCFNTAVVDAFGLPKCETEEVQKTVWEEETGTEEERKYTECKAVKGDKSACACCAENGHYAVVPWQRGWTGNKGVKQFLEVLRITAAPVDFDFELEDDKLAADGGGRVANKVLVEDVFADMVTVQAC